MLRTIRKPFGYEPIIKKEDMKGSGRKKKERAGDWKSYAQPNLESGR